MQKMPERGELVVVRITKINPHSAYAHLEEYDAEGLIHVSEVASGWVRDIRSFLKTGDVAVAKVMRTDRGISLSLRRVDASQEKAKLREYKLELRAEKLLEIAAKQLGKTLEEAYKEVGYPLRDAFGTLYAAFKAAVTKPEKLSLPEEWLKAIREVAEKNITLKEFEFKAHLYIKTSKPDGVHAIKDLLAGAEKSGLSVKYIAAPKYLVAYKTRDAKKGSREFESLLAGIQAKGVDVKAEIIK